MGERREFFPAGEASTRANHRREPRDGRGNAQWDDAGSVLS
jgi:hypothetical protein